MRTGWDAYFMGLAHAAAKRSTCPRLHVGAVLVKKNELLSSGYNGSPSGEDHCDDVGCLMVEGSCKRTIHAEENALLRASFLKRVGSTIYITDTPCIACATRIASKGVAEVVYDRDYIQKKKSWAVDNLNFQEEYAITKKLNEWQEGLSHIFDENGIVFRHASPDTHSTPAHA